MYIIPQVSLQEGAYCLIVKDEKYLLSSVHQVVASTSVPLLPPSLIDLVLWAQMIDKFRCAMVSYMVVLQPSVCRKESCSLVVAEVAMSLQKDLVASIPFLSHSTDAYW